MYSDNFRKALLIISIILILLIFIYSGINKFLDFENGVNGLQSKFKFSKQLSIVGYSLVIFLEIIAPLLIIISLFYEGGRFFKGLVKFSLISLILFTIIVSILYHTHEIIPLLKNMGLIGGMILILLTIVN
jgi:uncharacterized membrane protein YphA (DoxX/SURF4 family)